MNHVFNQITVLKSNIVVRLLENRQKYVHGDIIPQLLDNAIWRHLQVRRRIGFEGFAPLTSSPPWDLQHPLDTSYFRLACSLPSGALKTESVIQKGGQTKCLYKPLQKPWKFNFAALILCWDISNDFLMPYMIETDLQVCVFICLDVYVGFEDQRLAKNK